MAPLIVLLSTYALARLALRKRAGHRLPGRLALAAMLVLTGVSHFTRTDSLAQMVPPALPAPVTIVLLTGVLELALALGLLVRATPGLGWSLAALFIALLPANVHSAVAEVGLGGHGPAYLWFRVPLQGLFIAWALACTGALRWQRRRDPQAGRVELVHPLGKRTRQA